eukprot:CAMPEP_0196706492 /NCGR_PEP_ID=MMETSP1090-20130531/62067_1 /TAXON_ID=37098 /ORGANISM="Isochrysis sp, Strain CCMP1244" /LENGTH=141 /DNA_ID=CAMNT_0042046435 /DNA_START=224 /DNA_END=646 /DNA_ORIENTATION=-
MEESCVEVERREEPASICGERTLELRPSRESAPRQQRVEERRGVLAWPRGGAVVEGAVVDAVVGDQKDGRVVAVSSSQREEVRRERRIKRAHHAEGRLVSLEIDRPREAARALVCGEELTLVCEQRLVCGHWPKAARDRPK